MLRRRFRVAAIFAFLLLTGSALQAQSDRGTITGTVQDPAGAVVPGATVGLLNTATGSAYQTVTTETGNYTLPSLPAGNYELTVNHAGFGKFVQQNIQVQVTLSIRIDVVLQIGTAAESVTVTAGAPLLRTESAEQSFNITGDQVNALPLTQGSAGLRNPIAFAQLTPGMSVPATNTTGNFQARVNGLPANSFRTLVDGQDITNSIDPSHLSESHPSMEALQEVSLASSNFAAEFGRVSGGLFNLTSRSGTNQFHGSGYEFLTNEGFGAGRPLTNDGEGHLLRPRNRSHDYGFSVGGPVRIPKVYDGRNRTFFFFNFEQWRLKASSSGTFSTVPTSAYRQGDFSAALTGRVLGTDVAGRPILENQIFDSLSTRVVNGQTLRDPFPNNVIPSNRIDPIAAKIQAMIPAATTAALVNNYAIVDAYTTIKSIPSIKIDQNFGLKTKLSFYWSQWRQDRDKNTFDGLPFPISPARIYIDRTPSYRLNLDHTLTPTLLLHFGAGLVHYIHTDSAPDSVLQYDAVKELGPGGGLGYSIGIPDDLGAQRWSGRHVVRRRADQCRHLS